MGEEKGQLVDLLEMWGFGFQAMVCSSYFLFLFGFFLSTSFSYFSSCTMYIREEMSKIVKCFALTASGQIVVNVSFH